VLGVNNMINISNLQTELLSSILCLHEDTNIYKLFVGKKVFFVHAGYGCKCT